MEEQQSRFVVSNSPERSESNFDIDETESWLVQQENLRKEQEENRKKLERMAQSLVLPPAEDDNQVDEEIRILREELHKSYSALKRDLSKSLPDSIMFSGQSSPNNTSAL